MTIKNMTDGSNNVPPPRWWTFGYVWLVIAGPLIVVVAAIFTAVLAFSSKDVIVSDNDPKTAALANYRSLMPAQAASYHAATPDAGVLAARARVNGSLLPVPSQGSNSSAAAREPIQ